MAALDQMVAVDYVDDATALRNHRAITAALAERDDLRLALARLVAAVQPRCQEGPIWCGQPATWTDQHGPRCDAHVSTTGAFAVQRPLADELRAAAKALR
jgi:hypothetical protein